MPKNENELLRISGLRHHFGKQSVLENIDVTVRAGECIGVIGPSGCGKTLLLRILAGLQKPSHGEIRFDGGTKIAFAFQKSPLFPWLSLGENVNVCMNDDGRTSEQRAGLIREYFQAAGLADLFDHYPRQISVGMQQRVNVTRAFCHDSRLVLMDEPFVSLDFPNRLMLQELSAEFCRKENKTLIFVTHDIDEAIFLSDRILVFSAKPGRIIADLRVQLPKPRTVRETRVSEERGRLFKQISTLLMPNGSA